jgi:hypothetical protein
LSVSFAEGVVWIGLEWTVSAMIVDNVEKIVDDVEQIVELRLLKFDGFDDLTRSGGCTA